jgi:methylaspartate ammonia-lyase
LVDDIPQQLGESGEVLTRYMRWLHGRMEALGGGDCTIHLDLHGALGTLYNNNLGRVLGQIRAMELVATPHPLRIESPVIMQSREAQIEAMQKLCDYLRLRRMDTQLVVDEWANTLEDIQAFIQAQAAHMIQIKMPDLGGVQNSVEAVLACQAGNVGAFLGGSCAETNLSARVSVHVALATRPDIVMAKPGMGVDEAVMLTQNEMGRTLAQIQARQSG